MFRCANGTDKKISKPRKGVTAFDYTTTKKKIVFCFHRYFIYLFFWGANNKSKWIAALKIYSTEKYIHYMVLCIYSEILYCICSFSVI